MKRKCRIIGAATGWGAQLRATERGPDALKEAGLFERLLEMGSTLKGWDTLYPLKRFVEEDVPLSQALPLVHDFNLRLADLVTKTLEAGEFPLILGGDHSIAVGTWNGVYQHLQKKSKFPLGLIWIDAHMDAHTPETTPSGAWHGMPLAGLLGFGDPKMANLKGLGAVVQPENLCIIVARSFEEGEEALLKKLNVKVVYAPQVLERGFRSVLHEAIAHVTRNTACFGVSLDLDCVDPTEAPGVGSPETGGVKAAALLEGISHELHHRKDLISMEVVEYNPERNHLGMTAELCFQIIKAIL
jgi:arginase